LVNAVEHGNLGITYEEKSRLNEKDQWEGEVKKRMEQPEHSTKRVLISFERTAREVRFLIKDEGAGFDWRPYMAFDPKRVFDSHGRGIAVAAQASFDRLDYRGVGNEVLAVVQNH